MNHPHFSTVFILCRNFIYHNSRKTGNANNSLFCNYSEEKDYLCKTIKKQEIMAIEIKPIPVLRGKVAERFVEEADRNARERRGSIDFTKQVEKMRAILKRSKLYNIDKEG